MENEFTLKYLGICENQEPLFIEKIEIKKRVMKLRIPFEASYGRFNYLTRLFPVITFRTQSGEHITGIGECSPLNAPSYNYECCETVEAALRYIIAGLTGKKIEEADGFADKNSAPVTDVISFIEKYKWITGHNMAKAGVEGAYWDAAAKLNRTSVSKLWGGSRTEVETGTSVGLEPSIDKLMNKIDIAVQQMKVARIKIKVKPGRDVLYLDAIRKRYPDIRLQVDANAAYDLFNTEHLALLKEFDNYDLSMIEQPGCNDDILDHSRRLAGLNTPICLDESILHAIHARQAIELWEQYSSIDKLIINVKPPRVGGYLEAIKIAKLCSAKGVSVWCGGMYESVIGKTANVHFSSRAEVNLPGDHISQAPYFYNDVADAPVYKEGRIVVPNGTGWGLSNLNLD
jgi:o-succinylbenzoate synthase